MRDPEGISNTQEIKAWSQPEITRAPRFSTLIRNYLSGFCPAWLWTNWGDRPSQRRQRLETRSVAQEGETVCFYTGLVTTFCVGGVRLVEEPRNRPIGCHNGICPSSKHMKSLAHAVIF